MRGTGFEPADPYGTASVRCLNAVKHSELAGKTTSRMVHRFYEPELFELRITCRATTFA
jgi:hypothetical protein